MALFIGDGGLSTILAHSRANSPWLAEGQVGRHLEELVRISVRPVLVAEGAFRPIQRFLIAFDNSPSARKAIDYAVTSSLLRGLECHLIMVGRADARHEADLNEARERLARAGYVVAAKLKPGKPARLSQRR